MLKQIINRYEGEVVLPFGFMGKLDHVDLFQWGHEHFDYLKYHRQNGPGGRQRSHLKTIETKTVLKIEICAVFDH